MKKTTKAIVYSIIGVFALIGVLFTVVFFGMQFGIFNVRGSTLERNTFFKNNLPPVSNTKLCRMEDISVCDWRETEEWNVVKEGLLKDVEIINRVSRETGVSPRMIAAVVVPEQIRFFTANREVFKRYFEPLKILGSLSQFSLGVSGIKQDTAEAIEKNILDSDSEFCPGQDFSPLIAYNDQTDKSSELYNRLTDSKNHYYSYLYTALFIKQIESQWKGKGFNITKNPGVITTLFNLGFSASKPNAYPIIGGSLIEVGGKTYVYGELGSLFYESTELIEVFPR